MVFVHVNSGTLAPARAVCVDIPLSPRLPGAQFVPSRLVTTSAIAFRPPDAPASMDDVSVSRRTLSPDSVRWKRSIAIVDGLPVPQHHQRHTCPQHYTTTATRAFRPAPSQADVERRSRSPEHIRLMQTTPRFGADSLDSLPTGERAREEGRSIAWRNKVTDRGAWPAHGATGWVPAEAPGYGRRGELASPHGTSRGPPSHTSVELAEAISRAGLRMNGRRCPTLDRHLIEYRGTKGGSVLPPAHTTHGSAFAPTPQAEFLFRRGTYT